MKVIIANHISQVAGGQVAAVLALIAGGRSGTPHIHVLLLFHTVGNRRNPISQAE
jgi:hypothetical protein